MPERTLQHRRTMLVCVSSLAASTNLARAQPSAWEQPIQVPGVEFEVAGTSLAIGSIDADPRPDMLIVMQGRTAAGAGRFAYRIGWNVGANGQASSWSDVVEPGAFGSNVAGIGVAIGRVDEGAVPDIIIATRETATGADRLLYRVGFNLDHAGNAASWSNPIAVTGVGDVGAGGGVSMTNLDANPLPDLVMSGYEKVAGSADRLHYRIGWNLSGTGAAASWSTWRQLAGAGEDLIGVNLLAGGLDQNPRPDLLMVGRSSASGGEFRYRMADNLDATATPQAWSVLHRLPVSIGGSAGAAVALAELDTTAANARPELILGTYLNQARNSGAFTYAVGRDWDSSASRLSAEHRPVHPAVNEDVVYTATASDADGIATVEILVNGAVVASCPSSPCTFRGRPTRDPARGTVVYEARITERGGRTLSTGRREHQVGAPINGVFPTGAVPIWVAGPTDEMINVVFMRDSETYGGQAGLARFQTDVARVLTESYAADEIVGPHLGRFNFWYLTNTATTDTGCVRTVPNAYHAFGDVGAILHTDQFRDCASGGIFSSEPYEIPTIMHETGHAAFGLSDLYNGAGGLNESTPWPNVYRTRDSCRTDSSNHGWPPEACESFPSSSGVTWWRRDRRTSVMGTCSANTYPLCVDNRFAFDLASRRRVAWVLEGRGVEAPPTDTPTFLAVRGVSILLELNANPVLGLVGPHSVSIVRARPAEPSNADEALTVEYLSAGGEVLATVQVGDPRWARTIDPPYGLRRMPGPAVVRVPHVAGATSLRVSPAARSTEPALSRQALTIDLSMAFRAFCGGGSSDPVCR